MATISNSYATRLAAEAKYRASKNNTTKTSTVNKAKTTASKAAVTKTKVTTVATKATAAKTTTKTAKSNTNTAAKAAAAAKTAAKSNTNAAKTTTVKTTSKVAATVKKVAATVSNTASAVKKTVSAAATSTAKKVVQTAQKTASAIKQNTAAAVKQVKNTATSTAKTVSQTAVKVADSVKQAVKEVKPIDALQTALDVAGMVPIVGEAADGVNALIYAARGDKGNAILSLTSCIPGLGNLTGGAKLAGKAAKVMNKVTDAGKAVANISSTMKTASSLTKSVSTVASAVKSTATSTARMVKRTAVTVGNKVSTAISKMSKNVSNAVDNVKNKVTDAVDTLKNGKKVESGADVAEGAEAALKGGSSTVQKVFTDSPFDEAGNLKPNIKYQTGEFKYNYETDANGRISNWNTDNLQLTERDARLNYNSDTPGKIEGDHAGHLAGDRFGGSPELDNIVSQSQNVNLSQYKKIENQWAKAIKEGKEVTVNVDIKYDGDGLRPIEFNVEYTIDGDFFSQSILN